MPRPFAPKDLGVIRVSKNRFRRRRERWNPIWGFMLVTLLPVLMLSGLAWVLVNRNTSTTVYNENIPSPTPVAVEHRSICSEQLPVPARYRLAPLFAGC